MKNIAMLLGLLVIGSVHAAPQQPRFVDLQMFDTRVNNKLGSTNISGRGCTIVVYGPGLNEVSANTFNSMACNDIKDSAVAGLKQGGVGVTSVKLNNIEISAGIEE